MNVGLTVTTLAAAVAGAALPAVTPAATATASAASPAAAGLPVPHRALATTVSVENAQFTVDGERVTVDLEGRARLAMAAPSTGRAEATAEVAQQLTGTHPELGRITVTAESDAGSTVTYDGLVDPFPAKLDLRSDLTVEIEKSPTRASHGTAAAATRGTVRPEPLVLTTKNPGRLVGTLDAFPPKGELYRLRNPVDLALPDAPDRAIASIDRFPVKVGGLS